ncbi:MAG TPA: PHP domain-containing protein, partial [Candidatus Babeliaceae bacterium]|nr:PHP domain-containing protein [Candidatus Babeliaceae bacterium]
MSNHFTHLHVHTDYSLLDGAISIDRLVGFGKQHNLKALAISDHGNVFGAVKFFQQAQKAGIKPILGIEAYLTEDIKVRDADNKYYHLIILVENAIGYRNLCKLISFAYSDGFYFKPRIDYQILKAHAEGLIVTTACLGGHIPQLIMKDSYAEAEKRLDWFLQLFGPERFYLEVQPEDQTEQKILNERLFDLSKRKGIQCVATGDCHYVHAEDREA